jgi:hypothetical protein
MQATPAFAAAAGERVRDRGAFVIVWDLGIAMLACSA